AGRRVDGQPGPTRAALRPRRLFQWWAGRCVGPDRRGARAMRVKLKTHITGTRNGAEWPGYGEEVELPDQEAQDRVSAGMAEPVTSFRDAEKAVPSAAAEMREALVPK